MYSELVMVRNKKHFWIHFEKARSQKWSLSSVWMNIWANRGVIKIRTGLTGHLQEKRRFPSFLNRCDVIFDWFKFFGCFGTNVQLLNYLVDTGKFFWLPPFVETSKGTELFARLLDWDVHLYHYYLEFDLCFNYSKQTVISAVRNTHLVTFRRNFSIVFPAF